MASRLTVSSLDSDNYYKIANFYSAYCVPNTGVVLHKY